MAESLQQRTCSSPTWVLRGIRRRGTLHVEGIREPANAGSKVAKPASTSSYAGAPKVAPVGDGRGRRIEVLSSPSLGRTSIHRWP
jgi:hypothetical protein